MKVQNRLESDKATESSWNLVKYFNLISGKKTIRRSKGEHYFKIIHFKLN